MRSGRSGSTARAAGTGGDSSQDTVTGPSATASGTAVRACAAGTRVQIQPRAADGSAAEEHRPLRAGERVGGHHGGLHGIDQTANSTGQDSRRHLRCTP